MVSSSSKHPVFAVAGTGYVGLSLACLLSAVGEVRALDIVPEKVDAINRGVSPIGDEKISEVLSLKPGSLTATLSSEEAYKDCDYVIIATPTNYDPEKNTFDTSSIEAVLQNLVNLGSSACVVIKSTVPVGYTSSISEHYAELDIIFSPEFLREGHALEDNLKPSRVIVGVPPVTAKKRARLNVRAREFAEALVEGADEKFRNSVPVLVMGSTEAEAIKLFSNTYLALRVSFFNELDTYAQANGLNTSEIIRGVSLDSRIGDFYNNPSFGYGGYCLPKDSKQLLANYGNVPQNLIKAIVDSNETRKDFIAQTVEDTRPRRVGIYRLVMKSGSDNFRESSIQGIITRLARQDVEMLIYEPRCKDSEYLGVSVTQDIDALKESCDLILANRMSPELLDVKQKVYTRDLWQRD